MYPNYNRPTLSQLRLQVRAVFQAQLPGADMTLRRSVLGVIADVLAGLVNLLFGYLDYLVLQVFASTADWDGLLVQGAEYGLAPNGAQAAVGNVVFTGTGTSPIPVNTVLQGNVVVNGAITPIQVETTTAAALSAGTATVPAVALTPGSLSNLAANAPLTLVSAIAGVNAQAAVDGNGFSGGSDAEALTAFRSRVLARKQKPPQGGLTSDYQAWAMEVAGVTRAWTIPLNRGPGTVDVAFVMDGNSPIIPNSTQIAAVQTYIDGHRDANNNAVGRPVTDDCVVFAPIAAPLNFTISGLPESVQAAVTTSLQALISQTVLAEGLSLDDDIIPAIAAAAGGNAFDLLAPASDIAGATGTLITMGSVTF